MSFISVSTSKSYGNHTQGYKKGWFASVNQPSSDIIPQPSNFFFGSSLRPEQIRTELPYGFQYVYHFNTTGIPCFCNSLNPSLMSSIETVPPHILKTYSGEIAPKSIEHEPVSFSTKFFKRSTTSILPFLYDYPKSLEYQPLCRNGRCRRSSSVTIR